MHLRLVSWVSCVWKVSKCGVISCPYFPVFGLNTDQPEITSYLDTFHAVYMIRNTEAVVRRRFSKQSFYKSRKFHRKCCLESLFNKNAGLFLRTPFFTEHLSRTASERSCKSVFDTYFFFHSLWYTFWGFVKKRGIIMWFTFIRLLKLNSLSSVLCELVKRFYNNRVVNFMNLQIT